jgi:hypothetical protein
VTISGRGSLSEAVACVAGLVGVALTVGCGSLFEHEVRLIPSDPTTSLKLRASTQKRIAIVQDPAAVKPRYLTTLGGLHHWYVVNGRAVVDHSLQVMLTGKVREVALVPAPAPRGFDGYVVPQLEATIRTGFPGGRCLVTVSLQLKDAQGKTRATESHASDGICPAGREPEIAQCCSAAFAEAMADVAPTVLHHIDRL